MAAAVRAKRLRWRFSCGGERLVGVWVLGDFHRAWSLLNGLYVTAETAVLPITFCHLVPEKRECEREDRPASSSAARARCFAPSQQARKGAKRAA